MFRTRVLAFSAALLASGLAVVPVAAPASAAVDGSDPGRLVSTLTDTAFDVLRAKGTGPAARAQFRSLLAQYFAVDSIGERLIRRWLPRITPQQRAAYKAAFPNFIIGTYANNLANYTDAQLRVVRVVPMGATARVMTVVTRPGGRPLSADWQVERTGAGWQVSNLTVGGVNLALTQAADFDSIIQSRGFNALVSLMRSRG